MLPTPHRAPRPPGSPARRATATVLGACLAGALLLPAPATAAVPRPRATVPSLRRGSGAAATVVLPTATPSARLSAPELAPGLDEVPVSSPTYDKAAERAAQLTTSLQDATARRLRAIASLVTLHQRDVALTGQLADAGSRKRLAAHRIAVNRKALQDLAVANYISGGDQGGGGLDLELDVKRHNEFGKQQVMVGIVNSDKITKLRLTKLAFDKAVTQITIATAVRNGVRRLTTETATARDTAAADEVRFGGDLLDAVQDVNDARHLAMVDGLDFPLVVLDAYVKAADLMAVEAPGCHIQWWAMAGIGKTESRHGTFGGSEVNVDGSLTKPILGIPLDGSNSTAVVPGAGGFDRAQGPMQFISSTWASWGRDGNGDKKVDIQNFYDAAAGAAAYLCANGRNMGTDDGLRSGYFSYNQSLFYVAQVFGQAHGYEAALQLPDAATP